MSEENQQDQQQETTLPQNDYRAYERLMNARERGEDLPQEEEVEEEPSDATENGDYLPEAETAEESETSSQEQEGEEEEQEPEGSDESDDQEDDEEEPVKGKGGFQKRISKLTQKNRELQTRIEELEKGEKGEKKDEPKEPVKKEGELFKRGTDGKPVRPRLEEFETHELYEDALGAYEDARDAWRDDQIKANDAQKAEQARQEQSDREWAEAAEKIPDFQKTVKTSTAQISLAMERVMRSLMDPETGTKVCDFLCKNPKESTRIAKLTLATNESEFVSAVARAGIELGKISSKLAEKPPAPKPQKQITSAPKPPARVAGGRVAPKFDVTDEKSASDYTRWERAREAQLKR